MMLPSGWRRKSGWSTLNEDDTAIARRMPDLSNDNVAGVCTGDADVDLYSRQTLGSQLCADCSRSAAQWPA